MLGWMPSLLSPIVPLYIVCNKKKITHLLELHLYLTHPVSGGCFLQELLVGLRYFFFEDVRKLLRRVRNS